MQAQELSHRLNSTNPPVLVDVRTGIEFRRGHIPGAVHAPTWKVLLRLTSIPADRDAELVLTCEHGPRAQIVKGLLGLLGYRNMVLLDGQMHAWRQSGLPMEK
jgi:rhodanese-related sulfurtransferase